MVLSKEISPLTKKVIFGLFAVALLGVLFIFAGRTDGKLHLVICDVGQGDAIYLKTPKGDDVLIDGGPDNKVLSCLGKNMKFFDKTLELMILTHPQSDHLNGLIDVLRNYQVKQVILTTQKNQTSHFLTWQEELMSEKAARHVAKRGEKIQFGSGFSAEVIWPEDGISAFDLNDTAIVLRLKYGAFCALLTGDATNNVWLNLLASGGLEACQVLKVAHHGSKNATNEIFLKAIKPKIAIVSDGKNNRYGHPHKEVLDLFEKDRVELFRTDLHGNIEVITEGSKIEVKTDKI